MDQRIKKKIMTMHKALHLIDDVDRLYVSRKEGGRGLTSIEDSSYASMLRLKNYIKMQRDTDSSDQNQYRPYEGQQKKHIKKTKMRWKTTVWIS